MSKIKAGTVSDYSASMAEAIEKAFEKEWKKVKISELPSVGREDRQILFVAIAQGVVSHLKKQAEEAFHIHAVKVTQDANSLVKSSGQILVTSSGQIIVDPETYPGDKIMYPVKVTQDSNNRVTSKGDGKVEILTE